MDATISIGDIGLILLGIALLVLIIYCISLIRSLIPAAKSLGRVMEDVEVVTGVAAESAESAQQIIGDVTESVSSISKLVKGNQSTVAALTNLVNALAGLKDFVKKEK